MVKKECHELREEVMTGKEVCSMLGISQSYLYNLTSANKIPHYKPLGKKVYFKRSELVSWLEQSKVITKSN